ncbi:HDOD domain-containing protein [Thalassolituus sp. LLYu03]|uniref:HDOD domain-containing protein n=1 Tax=Thalassolituus sp. LLYu03 TaxID=3421656 RepID=UPI003D2E518E
MIALTPELTDRIGRGFVVPSKPQILVDIQQLIDDPQGDISQLARLISRDIGLSSAILKTINSPVYGMSRTISDIQQAVMLLGARSVGTLVTALLLRKGFKGRAAISYERLWDNSTMVAETMVFIGQTIKDKIPAENLYSTGLFHDCGIAAMSQKYPDYRETLQLANQDYEHNPVSLEDERYQCNHAQVGYFIASSWSLPADICRVVLTHHEEDFLDHYMDDPVSLIWAALKVADNMVNSIRRDCNLTDWSRIKHGCFEALGMTEMDYLDLMEDREQQMA